MYAAGYREWWQEQAEDSELTRAATIPLDLQTVSGDHPVVSNDQDSVERQPHVVGNITLESGNVNMLRNTVLKKASREVADEVVKRLRDGFCLNCKQTGHVASTCPVKTPA